MASAATDSQQSKLPYITQHCANGACEGAKKVSASGAQFSNCKGTYQYRTGLKIICHHKCHEDLRRLREMMGKTEDDTVESFAVPNPSVVSLSTPRSDQAEGASEPTTGDEERTFEQTDSGRKQRGELEYYVYEMCKLPGMQGAEVKTICTFIEMKYYPPSSGAVTAVLRRWEEQGLAKVADKPLRFMKFSDDVLAHGLDEMKARVERAAKRATNGWW